MPDLIPRREIKPFVIYERRPRPKGSTKYVVFKGNQQLVDFGKYSTAIRWCKQQTPRQVPHVVINADSKEAVATLPLTYTIIDGPHRLDATAIVDPIRVEEILSTTDPTS